MTLQTIEFEYIAMQAAGVSGAAVHAATHASQLKPWERILVRFDDRANLGFKVSQRRGDFALFIGNFRVEPGKGEWSI